MKRMASFGGLRLLGLIGALVVLGALVVGAAEGKSAHHKKRTRTRVLSNQQQTILDSGRISVKLHGTAGKRFRVDGFTGRRDRGRLTRSSKAGKGGKLHLRLVGRGRRLLGGCDVDFLKVVNAKAKHKKKRGKKRGHPHA
ncbi:MAG: hypothetical protein WBV53_07480, partial [Solirubrobacterales bacterium]